MDFGIYEADEIRVTANGEAFLTGQVQKGIRYHLNFYKDGELIFETKFPVIRLFGKRPKLIQHNLKYPIEEFGKVGLFGFYLNYDGNSILMKVQPLRKAYLIFYLNDIKIAEINYLWKVTFGYSECKMLTNTNNEHVNLYLLITYILFSLPR